MLSNVKLLHRGNKFADRGAGLFLKDLMHDGEWIHPLTNQIIIVTPEVRGSIEANMKKFLSAGNKVPMPDGHTSDTERNKGFWPGPFVAMGEDILAMAQPLNGKIKQQMLDGTADAVSVCWYPKYLDSNGNKYEDVFEHVCLTNYPVITKQRKFIALSGTAATDEAPMFDKAQLDSVAAHQDDEPLLRGLEAVYQALRGSKSALSGVKFDDLNPNERIAALLSQKR